ncbi:hypothetical protein, partial [Bacteroides finegoldii]|uniref:hypothetical protein n=1 Tax=Bacteroides finegoldii TaxID=338188 RepID=UPI0009EC6C90
KKDRRLGELNEKIKRKALLYVSFSLDFLERGTFTEYPFVANRKNLAPASSEIAGANFYI